MSSPFTTTMARGAGTMARGAGDEVIAGPSLPSGAGLSPCEHGPRTLGKCRALARHDIYRNFMTCGLRSSAPPRLALSRKQRLVSNALSASWREAQRHDLVRARHEV